MKKTWHEPEVLCLDMQETFGGTEETVVWDGWDWDKDEPDLTGIEDS